MKKFLKTLLLVFFLCILYAYTLVIEQIPKQITTPNIEDDIERLLSTEMKNDYNGLLQ